jgi:hypothetical protein
MNLTQTIRRILKEESDSRYKLLTKVFDNVFDNLEIEKTEPNHIQLNWYDSKTGKKLFERNHWGRFWIYDCDVYNQLRINVIGYLGFPVDEFENILINYLNTKYTSKFGDRELKDVGNENCDPDDFFM